MRTFPHILGNFATHVYTVVRVPDACLAALTSLLEQVRHELEDLQPVDSKAAASKTNELEDSATAPPSSVASLCQNQYHISFSRTVPIRLELSDALLAELREQFRSTLPFRIRISTPAVFTNDGKTRTFLGLSAFSSCHSGHVLNSAPSAASHAIPDDPVSQRVDPLISASHAASRAFIFNGLPKYYDNPQPHISIAWLLGDQEQKLKQALQVPAVREAAARLEACGWEVEVGSVVCQIGRKTVVVWKPPEK